LRNSRNLAEMHTSPLDCATFRCMSTISTCPLALAPSTIKDHSPDEFSPHASPNAEQKGMSEETACDRLPTLSSVANGQSAHQQLRKF
jgi:hypothetical protein